MSSSSSLSAYEIARLANIERNRQHLESLGLGKAKRAMQLKVRVKKKRAPRTKKKKRKRTISNPTNHEENSNGRKSRRLQGKTALSSGLQHDWEEFEDDEDVDEGEARWPIRPESDIFGSLPGIPVGFGFTLRAEACTAGIHRATVAGIVGRPDDGCYSIVLNGGYAESQLYALTATDISNGYANIFFDAPIMLAPSAYYFAANCYYIEDIPVRILDDQTVAQPWYASMIHLVSDGTSYSNGNAHAIRVLSGTAGIEETMNNSFDVYPNPASDLINVSFNEAFNGSVSILSLTGSEVMTSSVNGVQIAISTEGLSSGVYYVKVNNENTTQIEKIIVKK